MLPRARSPLCLTLLCVALLAGCSDDSDSTPSSEAEVPVVDAAGQSAGDGEPRTAEGARAGAQRWMDLYAAREYEAAWELLTAANREVVTQSDYAQAEAACDEAPGTPFVINDVDLHDASMAVVAWNRDGVGGSAVVWYEEGRWVWELGVNEISAYGQGIYTVIETC